MKNHEHIGLRPYPTTDVIQSKVAEAQEARDEAMRAALRMAAAAVVIGAKTTATVVGSCTARLMRKARDDGPVYWMRHTE
jgi:hypothetical protein